MLATNKDYALKLMSMPDSARDSILKRYTEYTIDRFTVKFIDFRQKWADLKGSEYVLGEEKSNYEERVREHETYLFENLDPVYEECITKGRVTFIKSSQQ